jgi:hypothetical protein
METSLHKQLKLLYAADTGQMESVLGKYRIDVQADDELIEIQHGSLAAIRPKIRQLLRKHQVRVVKPIIARKWLVRQDERGGTVLGRRKSPKQGKLLDVFDELIYFKELFPHRRLTVEVLLVEMEEWRYPGHGRRRRWRENDFEVEDQKLLTVEDRFELGTADDLRKILKVRLPRQFHTGHLAEKLTISRWLAQRIAYCLRHAGTAREVGKQGNALLYEFTRRKAA